MSKKRTFRRPDSDVYDPIRSEQMLTQKPIAVYYRQSTNEQVGNISTAIQTVDMVEELEKRGWAREHILLIDDDEGVSGTKRIDERKGMSHLFELIAERKIGAVACQDEDRLFRDLTQIQVNIFIDTCRKSQVKVITPYFTYDFAHPQHGEFHARQFRFKCDMAAEYLKSYVLGRLAPARQRLLREGKWAGASIPVGYMVDTRKHLPDGTENPSWRKFVPFEPYAAVVREHFRIFVECGGAIRKAMYQIRERGLSFPDCKPPEGFKICYQMKYRGDGYFVNRGNFVFMLTNPVYIGHWCTQGVVQVWDNHPPIVDEDTFMRAFNALSRYTLTGEENKDYQPAFQYTPPDLELTRPADLPLLTGLIYTKIDGKFHRCGYQYEKRQSCYIYYQHRSELEGIRMEWGRRSTWIDDAVVARFKEKLEATFNTEIFLQALQDSEQLAERERKMKRLQLTSLTEEMQNLVLSLKTLSHPYLIQEVEQRYSQMEKERERIQTEVANLDLKRQKQMSIEKIYELFRRVVAEWDEMTQDERRSVLRLFIRRIEASNYSRSGDISLRIYWQDGSEDEIQLWHKPHGSRWSFSEVEQLLSLFDSGASQLELAKTYPDLKWYQIFNEIKKHRGLVRFTPVYLGKQETYADFVARGGGKGKASPSIWRPEEVQKLREMVESGAAQIEIMQQFPFRRWIQLQAYICRLYGVGTRVPYSGISQRLTYVEYTQQNTSGVNLESAPQSIGVNSDRRLEMTGCCF